ncbi:MAG: type VI secretion system baseplate subunit TssG [Fibromonadaceae bacterium]|jgi:predicted component of type VI protein secretion system|nr:type VI secretion system baseplate subunit TssG [Fibromonadaceae bacterium]
MGIKKSFFQWMFSYFLNKNESRTLRIIGSNSLKHPSGDINSVKAGKERVLLSLDEMSLCGADSPLPDNLLKGIRTESENSIALAEFLNMLQHYLAMLRFNAILERSAFLMRELGNKKWQNRFALYNEIFSLEFLRCFFVKKFPNAQISVYCFEPMRIENLAPAFLGKATLDATSLLGNDCTNLTNAMRVDVCGISLEQSAELKRQKFFLNERFPFKIRVYFRTKIQDNEVCHLGNEKLSLNFWLGDKNFEDFKWERWV